MRNCWSESEAEDFVASATCERPLALLAYVTRLLGCEADLVMHGGGNTSCKYEITSVLGDNQAALSIKASGANLAAATPADFVTLDLPYLRRLLEVDALTDSGMMAELACHTLRETSRRGSVETLVHAALAHTFVLHTHPSAILALSNRRDGETMVARAMGPDVAVLPYVKAGLDLAHAVRDTMRAAPHARGLVLMHHGLVTWGSTAREAYDATIKLVSRAEDLIAARRSRPLQPLPTPFADREIVYTSLAPVIRGAFSTRGGDGGRVILEPLLDAQTTRLLDLAETRHLATSAPLTPDYIVRVRRRPLVLEQARLGDAKAFQDQLGSALDAFVAEYRDYVQTRAEQAGLPGLSDQLDDHRLLPRVLMIPGLGVVCVGEDTADARMVRDITSQGLRVKASIFESGGDYLPLADDHLFDMEFRAYQQAKTTRSDGHRLLRGRIALVTGAAGAIGAGLCESLLQRGAHVAAADLPGATLDGFVADLARRYPSQILGVDMNVTDAASVAAGFDRVARVFGGVDALVVNAGIAHVASLVDLDLEAFRKLEAVNVEGTLLVLAEAGRRFARQGVGGDIVLVSTKNVFAPGAGFGAYSATKAASHQLARIASLEFAAQDVRVNMVAPDAVFSHGDRRSGLWAAVGPNRMKARGLDERGLEEYYRSRNLLKAQVTAEHVAAAVLFFITRQTPTTGATIPVDGGLPDATPR